MSQSEKRITVPTGEQSPVCQLTPPGGNRKPEPGPLTVKAQAGLEY